MTNLGQKGSSYIGAGVALCLFFSCFAFGYLYLEKTSTKTVAIQFYASREVKPWIDQAAKEFNSQKHTVDKKVIIVYTISEESLKKVKARLIMPELWSPGDTEQLAHASIAWDEKEHTPLFSNMKSLIYVQDPMGRFWVEHFVMFLKKSWITEEKAAASELFVEFLLTPQGQQFAEQLGLKPIDELNKETLD
jgi:hypothetical protein